MCISTLLRTQANEAEMMAGVSAAAEEVAQKKGGRKPQAWVRGIRDERVLLHML